MTKKCRKCEAEKSISLFAPKQWTLENPMCRECDRVRRIGDRVLRSKEERTRTFRMAMAFGVGNCSMKIRENRVVEARARQAETK